MNTNNNYHLPSSLTSVQFISTDRYALYGQVLGRELQHVCVLNRLMNGISPLQNHVCDGGGKIEKKKSTSHQTADRMSTRTSRAFAWQRLRVQSRLKERDSTRRQH